jgi:sec-independent protein translocase protein TatB
MFDLGFSELLVIALVALIVLAGRLQRYVADVKADINREMELDELRKMRDSMQSAASDMQSSFDAEVRKTESELNSAAEGRSEPEVSSPPKAAGSIEEKQKA